MAFRKKKVYKFSDEVMSKDALVSLLFGVTALLIIIFSVVMGIVMKGNAPDIIGTLLVASIIMGVTGLIFGFLSYGDSEGGLLSKRASVIISIIDLVALALLYLF